MPHRNGNDGTGDGRDGRRVYRGAQQDGRKPAAGLFGRGGKPEPRRTPPHATPAPGRMDRRLPDGLQWEIPPDLEMDGEEFPVDAGSQAPTVWDLADENEGGYPSRGAGAGRQRQMGRHAAQDAPADVWQLMDVGDAPQEMYGWEDAYADEPGEWEQPARRRQKKPKRQKTARRADAYERYEPYVLYGRRQEPTQKRKKSKQERPYKHPRKAPRRERRERRAWTRRRTAGTIVFSVLGVLALLAVSVSVFWLYTTRNDDLWLDLDQVPYRTETVLYYTDQQTGESGVYATLPCTQNKEYVPSEQIPQQLRDAFVAVEDRKFYSHSGVDIKRTVYAVFNELRYKLTGSGIRQGASTIDQQLIKNLTRDDDDSNMAGYLRKLREVYRAWRMEAHFSKDEILDAYLNTISFTGNTAGVQAEAKKQFGKPVDQLSLAECASLAAITRNPARYNPATHPDEHKERRDYVLELMLEQGYINQSQHDEAVATPVSVTGQGDPARPSYVTSYFTDAVMDEVRDELVDQRGLSRAEASNLLYNGGLRIYTTVVPALQSSMEETLRNGWLYPRPGTQATGQLKDENGVLLYDEDNNPLKGKYTAYPQAAMVSLDYDGGICAVVGGLGDKTISRGFNRATQANRQVGSTMKPIGPYAVAFKENKITWSSAFNDSTVRKIEDKKTGEMIDWPSNVTNTYSGRDILVREGLAQSVNTVAVRVGDKAGIGNVYRFVKNDLEIPTIVRADKDAGPMVLGSSTHGISPVEMAKAYAMFGNGGYVPTVHTFGRITAGTGTSLLVKETASKQVLDRESAYILNRLMREVVVNGTAAGMGIPGEMDSVGKTGTTSDNRDHWFVGLTPYYVTASWYGYDENMPLGVDNSNHPPTLAWRQVMSQGQAGLPYKEFPSGGNVGSYAYCTASGSAAGPNCPAAQGVYKNDHLPKSGCPVHGG